MHDIDRTQAEMAWETDEFENEDEYGYEFEGEEEWYGETGDELFDEADEMELAAQLLEVSDEAELEQFIGGLIKRAGRALKKVVKGPIGSKLRSMLKGVAKRALPRVTGALDSVIPGAGGIAGNAIQSAAGQMFGLELEGMSAEDQEFEVARRYVRLAGEAVKQATDASPSVPPQQAAKQAIVAAAQQHAPGLVNGSATGAATGAARANGKPQGKRAHSGRWVRRGGVIILTGI